MNWPPLSSRTSEILAEVLRDCVHTRPANLFEYVAQALQDKSGLDPDEFKQQFEECLHKPRTYVLEDRVPAGQDPYAWVPMRYNDDTIMLTLRLRAAELTSEILAAMPIPKMKVFLDRMCVAFPELMYMRSSPSGPVGNFGSAGRQELETLQGLRALYIGCSGCNDVTGDDESVELSFHCEALVREARETLLQPAKQEEVMEALIVFTMLRALGANDGFCRRYGGGPGRTREEAALHAIEHSDTALPSFRRLSDKQKSMIKAALQVFFPLSMLITTEAVPAHFLKAKDQLLKCEGAMDLYKSAVVLEHMVSCRGGHVRDEAVDFVKLALYCLESLDKYSGPRAYELFLKKRAERHSWRVIRDDLFLKAATRLCCLAGLEDTDAWNDMLHALEQLPEREQEVLQVELARKDGCTDLPVYILSGAGKYMKAACASSCIGAKSAVLFLARILEDARRLFDHAVSPNQRTVMIDMSTLEKRAQSYTAGGSPFEDTPFTLQEAGMGRAVVRLAGDPEN